MYFMRQTSGKNVTLFLRGAIRLKGGIMELLSFAGEQSAEQMLCRAQKLIISGID
jgi:hypothetical protein